MENRLGAVIDKVETVIGSSKTIPVDSTISLNQDEEVKTPTKINSLLVAARQVSGEDSGAADEEYSQECSNYSEDEDEVISHDGNEGEEAEE